MINLVQNMFQRVMVKYVPLNWLMCIEPRFLKLTPDDLKTQEMCNKAVVPNVPAHFRTKKMCERAFEKCLHPLRFISDHLKTQEMCEKAVEKDPYQLSDFPDCLKTQEMC